MVSYLFVAVLSALAGAYVDKLYGREIEKFFIESV